MVGAGEVTSPLAEDRTQAAVTLTSRAAPGATGVRYEYKADISSTGTWAVLIAAVDLLIGGSALLVGYSPRAAGVPDSGKRTWDRLLRLAPDMSHP